MTNKIAQNTKFDKELVGNPSDYQIHQEVIKQQILPFYTEEHWQKHPEQYELESGDYEHREKQLKDKLNPKSPMSLQYPELTPDQIKYRALTEQEKQRLVDEDNDNYRRWDSQYWNKDKAFESTYKRQYELNKQLPEEAKKAIIHAYDLFRSNAAAFQAAYNEANTAAGKVTELDYSGTYIDLFKNFSKFVIASIHKRIGELFGIIPKNKATTYGYARQTKYLADFINEGINIFNITPLNYDVKLHEMREASRQMKSIMAEYEKRKKVLKKLPLIELDVKRYLLKKDTRAFLKWMDEYFSNDKQDFMQSNVANILNESNDSGSNFRIGDLNKIKTYSEIWFKAQMTSTFNLKRKMQNDVSDEILKRLTGEVIERMTPKISAFESVIENADVNNTDELLKYVHKNFGLDLKSILNFTRAVYSKYYEDDKSRDEKPSPKEAEDHANEKFAIFKSSFMKGLQSAVRDVSEYMNKHSSISTFVVQRMAKLLPRNGNIDRDAMSKLTNRDINELVSAFFRDMIINQLPNFESHRSYQSLNRYALPYLGGLGSILKETGKFSIESIVNNVHEKVPFVPKDFILNLVRSTLKNQLNSASPGKVFDDLDLRGTIFVLAMRIFLDLLTRSGKSNPNSFTNEFVKSFNPIYKMVGFFLTNVGQTTETKNGRTITKDMPHDNAFAIFAKALRNTDTITRDLENLNKLSKYIHDSAGKLDKNDVTKIISNKNFNQYSKIGIVKKVFDIYAKIKNMGELKGIYDKYSNTITTMKTEGYVSKTFDSNIRFIIKVFNLGEQISPASTFFKKLFEATAATETDLESIEDGEALADLLKDYQKKDSRLFNLDLVVNDRLKFRVLKDKDPRTLRVGIESNCCQRIGGVGEAAAKDSFVNPLAGVLILEWENNNGEWVLLTQSYFHYVPKDNSFILDNIESNNMNAATSDVNISAAYAYLARTVQSKYNVKYFLAGKSYSKVNTSDFKTDKMKGGDPRFFSPKAGSPYTDFSPSNSMNLLKPTFDLDKHISQLTQTGKDIRQAFEFNLQRIIKIALVA